MQIIFFAKKATSLLVYNNMQSHDPAIQQIYAVLLLFCHNTAILPNFLVIFYFFIRQLFCILVILLFI
jgi:hypothetical protein